MKIQTTTQLDEFFKTTAYWPGLYSKFLVDTADGECFCHSCATRERLDIQEKFKDGHVLHEESGNNHDPKQLYCVSCSCDLSDYAED